MHTKEFIKAYKAGRAALYVLDLGWESNMLVVVIYGQSGGSKADVAKTETIIDTAKEEIKKHPYMATIMIGDFNAEPDALKSIQELIEEEQWVDIGRNASRWGGVDAQTTCQTNPKAKPSRIDGAVANKAATAWIKSCRVKKDDMIPTHFVVQLELKRKAAREERTYAAPLPSLKKLFEAKLKEIVGEKKGKEKTAIRKHEKELLHKSIDQSLDKVERSSTSTDSKETRSKRGHVGQRRSSRDG